MQVLNGRQQESAFLSGILTREIATCGNGVGEYGALLYIRSSGGMDKGRAGVGEYRGIDQTDSYSNFNTGISSVQLLFSTIVHTSRDWHISYLFL
jgi:hypothetical protein